MAEEIEKVAMKFGKYPLFMRFIFDQAVIEKFKKRREIIDCWWSKERAIHQLTLNMLA